MSPKDSVQTVALRLLATRPTIGARDVVTATQYHPGAVRLALRKLVAQGILQVMSVQPGRGRPWFQYGLASATRPARARRRLGVGTEATHPATAVGHERVTVTVTDVVDAALLDPPAPEDPLVPPAARVPVAGWAFPRPPLTRSEWAW